MNIDDLIKEIIPPATYHYRNGFSNEDIIDSLSPEEKSLVEDRLIQMLLSGSNDLLIIETLVYMRAIKAVPIIIEVLERVRKRGKRLVIIGYLYELTGDKKWIREGMVCFKSIRSKHSIMAAFYTLYKFGTQEAKDILESYVNHKDVLLQSNSRRFLKMLKEQNQTPP